MLFRSSTNTFDLVVTPVNDPPFVVDDRYVMSQGDVLVVATNCNGGIKEVLLFDDVPDRWALWADRCPDNADFRARTTRALRPPRARARTLSRRRSRHTSIMLLNLRVNISRNAVTIAQHNKLVRLPGIVQKFFVLLVVTVSFRIWIGLLVRPGFPLEIPFRRCSRCCSRGRSLGRGRRPGARVDRGSGGGGDCCCRRHGESVDRGDDGGDR